MLTAHDEKAAVNQEVRFAMNTVRSTTLAVEDMVERTRLLAGTRTMIMEKANEGVKLGLASRRRGVSKAILACMSLFLLSYFLYCDRYIYKGKFIIIVLHASC